MALNRRSLETTISSRTRDLDAFVSILIDNRGPQHRLAIKHVVDVQLLLRFKEPEGFLLRAPCILCLAFVLNGILQRVHCQDAFREGSEQLPATADARNPGDLTASR